MWKKVKLINIKKNPNKPRLSDYFILSLEEGARFFYFVEKTDVRDCLVAGHMRFPAK